MIHILKFIAAIVVITYALRLVNAQSDILVFSGLAIIALSLYFVFTVFEKIFTQLKTKL